MIQLYAAVYEVCMQALSRLYSSEVHQLALFFHHFTFDLVYRFLSNLHPSTVCFWSLFFFFFTFYFCLPILEDCEPAVWRHLISCVCLLLCWATKDCTHYKLFIVFKEMCYWTALHAGHVWFFSFFFSFLLCLKMSFFVGWLQHGIHTSFMASSLFWDSNKKVTGLPTPPPCNLYNCISAVLKCTTIGCH